MLPSLNPIKASIVSVTDPGLGLEKGQIPQTPLKHTIRLDPERGVLGDLPLPGLTLTVFHLKKHSKSRHPEAAPVQTTARRRHLTLIRQNSFRINIKCKRFPLCVKLCLQIYSFWLLTLVSVEFPFYRRSV